MYRATGIEETELPQKAGRFHADGKKQEPSFGLECRVPVFGNIA
jgi:hypothetical protein